MRKLDKESVIGITALLVHAANIDEIYSEHEKDLITSYDAAYNEAEDAKKIFDANPNIKVLIEGDKMLPYGKIVEVMEVLRQSGASGVALITQPPQE